MKKSKRTQRVLFYALLIVFSLMLLYNIIELLVFASGNNAGHPVPAAISFAHLFYWIPVTALAIALLLTNYTHLQRKCHSVKKQHKYKKVLKRYLLLYAAVITLSLVGLLWGTYLPFKSTMLVVGAYIILVVTTVLLLRHSVRLKDYMEE